MVFKSNTGAMSTCLANSRQKTIIKSVTCHLVESLAILSLLGLLASCGGGGGGSAGGSPTTPSSGAPKNTVSYPDYPTVAKLVSVISIEAGALTVDWLPADDAQTAHSNMEYTVHVSEAEDFIPSQSTATTTVTGAISTTVNNLKTATRYYVAVVAKDESGNESWSNHLNVVTVSTVLSRTNAVVHVHKDSAVQSVTDSQVIFDEASGVPAVGEIIVGTKNGGYLRKVTQVATSNGQVTAQTESASLNEVFEEFEFATSVKFGNYADQALSTTSKIALSASRIAGGTSQLHWPSGLTMISDASATIQSKRSLSLTAKFAKNGVDFDGVDQIVYWGGESVASSKAFVRAPAYSFVQPNDTLNLELEASIVTGKTDSQICKIEFEKFSHKDSTKNSLPMPPSGKLTWVDPENDKISAKYLFSWKPTDAYFYEGSLPYLATFRVYIDSKEDNCGLGFWQKKLDITVPIYVGKAQSPDIRDQKKSIDFTGGFDINDVVTVNFEPSFDVSAKISTFSLESAKVAVSSDITLINELTITADGAGKILPDDKPLFENKKFIRIFYVGGVPVLVAGEFGIKMRVEGEVTGALSLKETIEFTLAGAELGMVYSNSRWDAIGDKGNPSYRFELKGEGTATAEIKVTLIPDFQLRFYDAASGRILLEPYTYGNAAIQGQFIYRNNNGQTGSDADYWFNELVAGAGMDMRLFAGLKIFDFNVASYPKDVLIDQVDKFEEYQIFGETPIWGLPTLAVTESSAVGAVDSRSILITGTALNTPFPFSQNVASLNPFEQWTTPKVLEDELLVEDDRAVLQQVTVEENNSTVIVPGKYHFVYTQPGNYKVRLFGYSEAGPFFRQMTELDISLTDNDDDGMIDQWETEYGLQNPINDLDGDGLSNLQEFQLGTNPIIKDNPSSEEFDITISSAACSIPTVGETMTCTILGTNLPELTQFAASNCEPYAMAAVAGGDGMQREFTCIPTTAGSLVEVEYMVPGFIGSLPWVSPIEATLPSLLFLGVWEGTGYQDNNNASWSIRVTINDTEQFIDYPSLNCGGTLELISQDESRMLFQEKLTYGLATCVDNGQVELLKRSSTEIDYNWYDPSGNQGAGGSLTKYKTNSVGSTVVRMETNKGAIVFELYPDMAPLTVANFLEYVNSGAYDGTIFHRVIEGFVNQGGGYTANYEKVETRDPILNEADNGLKNLKYTIAMARTSDPHSATNQFFINTANNDFLDHTGKSMRGWGYAVFGKVIEGENIVDEISKVETGLGGPFGKDVPLVPVVINIATEIPVVASPPNYKNSAGYMEFVEGNPGIEDDGVFIRSSRDPNDAIGLTPYFTFEPKPLVDVDGVTITVVTKLPTIDAYSQIYFEFGYLGTECLIKVDRYGSIRPYRNTADASYYSRSSLALVTEFATSGSTDGSATITNPTGCSSAEVSGMFLNRIEFLRFGVENFIELDAVVMDPGFVNRFPG